jgi:hypothetical protein
MLDIKRRASTIDEFCMANRICRATFYNLLKAGKGPRTMKVLNKTLISVEAETDWRIECESESAQRSAEVA